jgi:hypothetical protein
MTSNSSAVLLVDWENLLGAVMGRGKVVERRLVDDLWAFANRRSGDQLHHSHMAAARFDQTIVAAMREHLIAAETVRSTKEQADILLTVLAMDYLHAGVGQFFLVTGDQDFIPLISRLHRDGRRVTVVYGDPGRLSGELRQALTTPGLESVDIAEVTSLRDRKVDTGGRALIGLLELQRRGRILGGHENGDRTALLGQWGVLENSDQTQYWALVEALCAKVARPDAATKAGNAWVPRNATRTYLKVDVERMADIVAVDHVVRRVSARGRGVSTAALRAGAFDADDGSRLDRALDALIAVELIRRDADGTYSLAGDAVQLGYLEQLWRVYAAVSAECYRRGVGSFPHNQLESLLGRRGVGQGTEQRAAGRVREAVGYAKAAGVIDAVAVEGKRHVTAPASPLSRPFEQAYHRLYRAFADRIGSAVPDVDVFAVMDADQNGNLFGYEQRDRHRTLRILAQSELVTWRDDAVTFQRSGWGETALNLSR